MGDRGGSWGEDGTIVFAPDVRVALSKVSSAGGSPQPLITLDKQAGEITQRWPQILPGGKAVLFTSSKTGGNYEDAEIVVYSMASGKRKSLQHGGFHARYLPSGHLVYLHEATLFAVPFDLKRLEVTGQPAPVLEGVITVPGNGGAQFSFSQTGNLVYVAGRSGIQNVSVYWMDARASSRRCARFPPTISLRSPRTGNVWLWESLTANRLLLSGCTSGIAIFSCV